MSKKIYVYVLGVLGWFALIAQFYLNLISNAAPVCELVIRYFSYFTILTNLLVATCCTLLLVSPHATGGKFFSQQKTLTAIAVNIFVVGLTYNLILRSIWNPQGLQKVVDVLLHSVIPALFIIFWMAFSPKHKLKWLAFIPWLAYPLIYLVFILIRGSFSGFYPYPFINVAEIGLEKGIINSLGIAGVFIITSLLFILVGNTFKEKE
jgi:hypothetical protein